MLMYHTYDGKWFSKIYIWKSHINNVYSFFFAARESVIDFTKPFMNLGISILFKVILC